MSPDRAEADIRAALAEAEKNLNAVRKTADAPETPTYASTVRALDRASDSLDRAWTYLNHLQSVADTPELRAALNDLMPPASDFYSARSLP